MREYERNGKPIIHSTQIKHWLGCPMKRKLTEQYSQYLENTSSKAAIEGKLFEGYVLGFVKESEKELRGISDNDKRKGIKDATVEPMKNWAENLKPYFQEGEPFKEMEYEDADYILTIEVDYDKPDEMLDLKKTSSIYKNWSWRSAREHFIQGIFYPYVKYLKTGDILPFTYVITESPYLIKEITIEPTIADFEWIKDKIENMVNEVFTIPNPSEFTCVKGEYGTCPVLNFCDAGREFLCKPQTIKFEELENAIS